MQMTLTPLLFVVEAVIYLAVVFMHLAKKNNTLVYLYVAQSLAVASLLLVFGLRNHVTSLLVAAGITFIVKAVVAPVIFLRAIRRQDLSVTASTYLSAPLTLGAVLLITLAAQSEMFAPVVRLMPEAGRFIGLALAGIFIAMFLTVNRKGILSQIAGVLGMENSIVALGSFLGLEQTLALELGIMFDMLLWMVIASVFISLIHRHFGTLNTEAMKHLTE